MDEFVDRRDKWQPKSRPDWVARLNEEGSVLDMESIVPLDEDSLIASAIRKTGLSDFGEDGWHEHFHQLITAINNEAQLNFMGRILTRNDMVNFLAIRLQVQDLYKRHPEINEQTISEPVMFLGHGRTGTTILLEVLSRDPQFRVVKRWEAMYPCPPPEEATYADDPRIEKAHKEITIFDRITPEWRAMHKFGGDLPVECAEFLYACFLSNVFPCAYQIPSYVEYMGTQDPLYTIRWHEKILKLLQWKYKRKHWLLKNPIWIDMIPQVLEVYPDAKIILTHRDPVVVADSIVNVMGTLYWWRTDDPWGGGMMEELVMPNNRAQSQNNLIRWMEEGVLKPGAHSNVLYQDFMSDPTAVIRQIYQDLSLTLTAEALDAMLKYLDDRPQTKYGKYKYKSIDGAALQVERKLFKHYQDYFGVESEI
tara:strand:+ start:8825 stop:10090 length:1266 start_codon:yes stop_codon:yes gene_type:complete